MRRVIQLQPFCRHVRPLEIVEDGALVRTDYVHSRLNEFEAIGIPCLNGECDPFTVILDRKLHMTLRPDDAPAKDQNGPQMGEHLVPYEFAV